MLTPNEDRQEGFLNPFAGVPEARQVCLRAAHIKQSY
jgi:hypothetical protein